MGVGPITTVLPGCPSDDSLKLLHKTTLLLVERDSGMSWMRPLRTYHSTGIYLSLFAYWAFQPRELNGRYFTVTCWTVFVLTNIDAVACLVMLIQGFWNSLSEGGPDTVFGMNMTWPFILQEYNYILIIFVCDALMVYRVWRLWQAWKWIALLTLSMMGLFQKVIAASLAVNTGVQIVITLLLGYRLLITDDVRSLPREQRSFRYRITIAIVESGLVITICLILNLAFLVNNLNIHWLFNLSIPHLYGITTMAIAVRLRATSRSRKSKERSGQTRRSAVGPTITVVRSFHREGAEEIEEPSSDKQISSFADLGASAENLELAVLGRSRQGSRESPGGVVIHKRVEMTEET